MGKFKKPNPQLTEFLKQLAAFCQKTGHYNLRHEAGKSFCYEVTPPTQIENAPSGHSSYHSLASLGFITAQDYKGPPGTMTGGSVITDITVEPLTIEFVEYLRRGRWAQRWIDLRHDLAHDDTIRSKIAWLIAGLVLAGVQTMILHWAGLI